MDRFSVWFSQLSPSADSQVSASAFDQADRYFLALRVGSAGAAAVWLWRFAAPGVTLKGFVLTAAFVAYSLTLYLQVWRRPQVRARAYLAVLPADLVFLFLICLWSAEPMSGVYLAFYVLVALHAFYFGATVGIAAATGFAGLYTTLYLWLPSAQRCAPEELMLRLGFAFFIAHSLALVSRQLRTNRHRLFEVNLQLQHRNQILEQTYRHLSVGRLAADVAHHINNPAAIIVGKAEVMRRQAEHDGLSQRYLQDLATIAESAFRIGGVIRSLLALSPQQDGTPQSVDIAKVTHGVILLFENRATQRHVHIEQRLTPGLRVHGQEGALRQVVVNLLCNALDAVEDGGEVVVETGLGAEPETVEVRVRDNGHGIPREHLDDVFSPFFTTKNGADGVGLGLSLSLTIVRRLGGTMRVDSAAGSGSTFTVGLPVDASPLAREEAA
ncbi:MAG: sensor histidine kinase [Candidatus Binatia bacterium]